MKRIIVPLCLACASFVLVPLTATAVTIDTVPVGNPDNAPDPLVMTSDGTSGYGSVAYNYRIGTYEVTNNQYVEFLNAKAATSDPLGLYTFYMSGDVRGGITQTLVGGSFSYAVKANMGDKPVNYVDWYDAVRFINWLNNGQGSGSTETGAYTLLGGTPVPSNFETIARNASATWVLPSENEWYKAAYHQPAAQGGDSDNYWLYATRANSPVPTIATANSIGDISNPGAHVANYQHATWNGEVGNVTTVGSAGPLSTSFYGTFDQSGNVHEWNEAAPISNTGSFIRGLRGGAWSGSVSSVSASYRSDDDFSVPALEGSDFGFRVVGVPEPSSLMLAAVGLIAVIAWGWRWKS